MQNKADSVKCFPVVTISAAARLRGIDRGTVKRYAKNYPDVRTANGMIDLESLDLAILLRQQSDARGFPLGRKRPIAQKWLITPKRNRKGQFPKSLDQRLEIIREQIEQMTDEEQVLVIRSAAVDNFYKDANFERGTEEKLNDVSDFLNAISGKRLKEPPNQNE